MTGVPRQNDLGSRMDRLERAVGELQRQSTLTSASIGSGGLTIRDNGVIKSGDFVHGVSGWQISGTEAEFSNLLIRDGAIGPDALARRVEAATATTASQGATSGSGANNRTISVTITVPTWAQTISVIAFGISNMPMPGRLTSSVTISGNTGSLSETSSTTASNVTAAHGRTFAAAGDFNCSVTTAAPGSTPVDVGQTLVVMTVFTKTS